MLQRSVVAYMQVAHPWALFKGNARDSGKMSVWQGARAKKLGQGKSWPDLEFFEPNNQYAGLFIELKADQDEIFTKTGRLREDEHTTEQAAMLAKLRKRGYYADFACSFDEAKDLIDWYLRGCRGNAPFVNLENHP